MGLGGGLLGGGAGGGPGGGGRNSRERPLRVVFQVLGGEVRHVHRRNSTVIAVHERSKVAGVQQTLRVAIQLCCCALGGRSMQWVFDVREGKGTAIFDRGRSRYEGNWRNDRRHGRGLESLYDGSRFAGDFEEDIRQGEYVSSLSLSRAVLHAL